VSFDLGDHRKLGPWIRHAEFLLDDPAQVGQRLVGACAPEEVPGQFLQSGQGAHQVHGQRRLQQSDISQGAYLEFHVARSLPAGIADDQVDLSEAEPDRPHSVRVGLPGDEPSLQLEDDVQTFVDHGFNAEGSLVLLAGVDRAQGGIQGRLGGVLVGGQSAGAGVLAHRLRAVVDALGRALDHAVSEPAVGIVFFLLILRRLLTAVARGRGSVLMYPRGGMGLLSLVRPATDAPSDRPGTARKSSH
jgi:hypothetical protein